MSTLVFHLTYALYFSYLTACLMLSTGYYNINKKLHICSIIYMTSFLPNTNNCATNLQAMLSLCSKINAPVKASKVEGPSTTLTFLGIHLNTKNHGGKCHSTEETGSTPHLQHCYNCTKRVLLSLISKLSFCCKVLSASRIFLCRLIDLNTRETKLHHHIPPTMMQNWTSNGG